LQSGPTLRARVGARTAAERHPLAPPARREGLHFDEPAASDLADADKLPRLRHALQAEGALPARPQGLFILAPDHARDVEAPRVFPLFEAERGERDGDLDRPARPVYVARREPARVPGEVHVAPLVRDERVLLHAERVD